MNVRFEVVGAETKPDKEHIETDAELGADVQHALAAFREHELLGARREQPEQRRAEQNAGDHLANHLRLLEVLLAEPADETAGGQDDGHLQKEGDRQFRDAQGA